MFAASIVKFVRKDDALTVVDLPFSAVRTFILQAEEGTVRGNHAHRQCSQFLICTAGRLHIQCHTHNGHNEFILNGLDDIGLYVPPWHWLDITFVLAGSVIVLCDRHYEEADYIRSYRDYINECRSAA